MTKNLTPNHSLSQFTRDSHPAWIMDYNEDMRTIDTVLGKMIYGVRLTQVTNWVTPVFP